MIMLYHFNVYLSFNTFVSVLFSSHVFRVNQKTFVIVFVLQKVNLFLLFVFTFIMSLVMGAIIKTMNYFICNNYLLHHNKKYYYNK